MERPPIQLSEGVNGYPWVAYESESAAAGGGGIDIAPGSTLTSLLPMGLSSQRTGAGAGAGPGPGTGEGQGKRALMAEAEAIESKRLKRLAKNRESARECRRRKKELKERVEAQLVSLEEENLKLRLQLKVGDEAEDEENAEILAMKSKLDDLVKRGEGEGQILETMDLLTERFADYGSAHTSAAGFHLSQLTRLLLPTLTTRVCMHAVLQAGGGGGGDAGGGAGGGGVGKEHELQQLGSAATMMPGEKRPLVAAGASSSAAVGSPSKPDGGGGGTFGGISLEGNGDASGHGGQKLSPVEGDGGGGEGQTMAAAAAAGLGPAVGSDGETVDMWSSLVDVLAATEAQQAAMRSQAGAISELARDLECTTQILERLRLLLADRNQTLDGEMAAIQRILTPTQSAKFVLWVSKNKACVHMLNQLWDKLHGGNGNPTPDDEQRQGERRRPA